MESVGAFDAKTRFSELLARAAEGESFLITKHGHPVARIVPETGQDTESVTTAVARLKTMRGTLKGASLDEVLAARHEGHRF